MTKRDKVTVDDIIGLVHTDEMTDSVEEVCKLRGRTNERFIVDTTGTLIDMVTRDTFDYVFDVVGLLNGYDKENEQLKKDCTVLIYHNQDYRKENEQLKKELSEYKDFVLSDDKILCYTCLFCTHKGIYEVDCDVKGHIDVHGVCDYYTNSCTKKELQE